MEAEPQHRHISHMYALYPGEQVFPPSGERPELIEAFRRSLEGRGDAGTGWSESWKMNAWARLGDAEHVMLLLNGQLKYVPPGETEENSDNFNYVDGGGVYPNLFDAIPPFRLMGISEPLRRLQSCFYRAPRRLSGCFRPFRGALAEAG